MKFDMRAATPADLTSQRQAVSAALDQLIQQLIAATAPLEGGFRGAGRAAFDAFKQRSAQVTADLHSSLAAIIGGQPGVHTTSGQGDQEPANSGHTSQSGATFQAARFASRR